MALPIDVRYPPIAVGIWRNEKTEGFRVTRMAANHRTKLSQLGEFFDSGGSSDTAHPPAPTECRYGS